MRTIKFEYGFESINGIVKKVYNLSEIPNIKEKCDVWNILPIVYVRQFSGLKDKNSKEIYEGDMFMFPRVKAKDEYLGTVNFDDDLWCFLVNESNGSWSLLYNFMTYYKTAFIGGNIYENKELI